jgi:hypothetical protein
MPLASEVACTMVHEGDCWSDWRCTADLERIRCGTRPTPCRFQQRGARRRIGCDSRGSSHVPSDECLTHKKGSRVCLVSGDGGASANRLDGGATGESKREGGRRCAGAGFREFTERLGRRRCQGSCGRWRASWRGRQARSVVGNRAHNSGAGASCPVPGVKGRPPGGCGVGALLYVRATGSNRALRWRVSFSRAALLARSNSALWRRPE